MLSKALAIKPEDPDGLKSMLPGATPATPAPKK
jgi:hypothetical protein